MSKKRYEGVKGRLRIVGFVLLLGLSILVIRLWHLQIVHGFDYSEMARSNRLHPERLKAARGVIFGPDTSVVLADNRPSCDLVMVPAECDKVSPVSVLERLQKLIGIYPEPLIEKIKEQKKQPFRQIVIKRDVSKTDLTRVEESSYLLPGVSTEVRPQRRYLYGTTACQILGYMNEVGLREIENSDKYEGGDLIGRAGLEQMYESAMRGNDGQVVLSVYRTDRRPQLRMDALGRPRTDIPILDSYGREIHEEEGYSKPAKPGEPVFTTLDIGLQQFCEELIERQKAKDPKLGIVGGIGAIAVLDAETGAVLALASTPRFDPDIFVTHGRREEIKQALTAKPNPVRNRCYQEQYAPGSVFKVMLATAALEEGVINEKTSFSCPGFFQLEGVDRKWHCWNHHGHGSVTVVDALAYSCDVFFYNVGKRLGVDKIDKWADKLGLGRKTHLDLPQELTGLIPSEEWKKTQLKKLFPDKPWEWKWYPGNTINLAIGQGEATTTPLQNAVMVACIVNGGQCVTPYVNKAVGPHLSEQFISPHTLELVRAGMLKCVARDKQFPTGTGKLAKIPGFEIIGKTGSAQMVGLEQNAAYGSEEKIPYALRDHAWFVCGVLDHEPKIAMCILIEHGHHGSSAAAPLAKEVINYFYSSRPKGNTKVAQVEPGR